MVAGFLLGGNLTSLLLLLYAFCYMVLCLWVLQHEIDVELLLDHVVDFYQLLVCDVVDLFGKVRDHFGYSALELAEFTFR